jgi:isoquinoline 1-oxidoreductase subunit beta
MSIIDKELSRRDFMKASAFTGLVVAFQVPRAQAKILEQASATASDQEFKPNAFLVIKGDDTVTVISKHLEMGQGVYTGIATVLAEELDVNVSRIKVQSAPADATRYANLVFGTMQGTGGSSAMSNSWRQLREAGATARAMLVAAAAKDFSCAESELVVSDGAISHPKSGRKTTYGALAETAAKMPAPKDVQLKDPKNFQQIGKISDRKDIAGKVNGQAQFAMDVHLKDMVYAVVLRPPLFGAKLLTVHDAAAKKVKGVREIVKIPQGVAIIADHFWPAKTARDLLKVTWDETEALKKSSSDLHAEYSELLKTPGQLAANHGALAKGREDAKLTIEATYEFPYLAHAPMETLNCVIHVKNREECTIWAGDQFQTMDQLNASKVLGLAPQKVTINTLFAGGSFGRRANTKSDYISEAAEIAKATKSNKGRPIHVIWTREDDIRGGFYRPMFLHQVSAGLDKNGKISFWEHRTVGQSIMAGTAFDRGGIDQTSVEGISDLAYDTESLQVDLHSPKSPLPVLWWRSVGHSHTAFVAETMIDELAVMAKADPVQFRLGKLSQNPRWQGVLKAVAEISQWGRKLPAGTGLGVAVHESFKTFVAQVAQVKVTGKDIRVEKVWCAVDCGTAINPDVIKAQMEGGIGFALSAALYGEITFDKGHVNQSNFHDYKNLRINEMPQVEVHIVPSNLDPTGVGEPGVPALAPAVANAIFAATGKRLRQLPFKLV